MFRFLEVEERGRGRCYGTVNGMEEGLGKERRRATRVGNFCPFRAAVKVKVAAQTLFFTSQPHHRIFSDLQALVAVWP